MDGFALSFCIKFFIKIMVSILPKSVGRFSIRWR